MLRQFFRPHSNLLREFTPLLLDKFPVAARKVRSAQASRQSVSRHRPKLRQFRKGLSIQSLQRPICKDGACQRMLTLLLQYIR